jgi:hypothetical protein
MIITINNGNAERHNQKLPIINVGSVLAPNGLPVVAFIRPWRLGPNQEPGLARFVNRKER